MSVEWFKGDIGQVCIIRCALGSPVKATILAQCFFLVGLPLCVLAKTAMEDSRACIQEVDRSRRKLTGAPREEERPVETAPCPKESPKGKGL